MYTLVFCFWLLLNGRITAEIVLIGIAAAALIGVFCRILFGYTPKQELRIWKKLPLAAAYVFVLWWEIIKASISVIRMILFRSIPAGPTLVTFQSAVHTSLGLFLLANSITLTPGTITVYTEDNRLTVHCLRRDLLDIDENSVFQRWIRRLEA